MFIFTGLNIYFSFLQNKDDAGVGEITQFIKGLPCKHEEMSSSPRTHVKRARNNGMQLESQYWGGREGSFLELSDKPNQ